MVRTAKNVLTIHFLLLLGYFRARQRFELPAGRDDVDSLRRRYLNNESVVDLTVSDHTRKRHVETILGWFRHRLCALEGEEPGRAAGVA